MRKFNVLPCKEAGKTREDDGIEDREEGEEARGAGEEDRGTGEEARGAGEEDRGTGEEARGASEEARGGRVVREDGESRRRDIEVDVLLEVNAIACRAL